MGTPETETEEAPPNRLAVCREAALNRCCAADAELEALVLVDDDDDGGPAAAAGVGTGAKSRKVEVWTATGSPTAVVAVQLAFTTVVFGRTTGAGVVTTGVVAPTPPPLLIVTLTDEERDAAKRGRDCNR